MKFVFFFFFSFFFFFACNCHDDDDHNSLSELINKLINSDLQLAMREELKRLETEKKKNDFQWQIIFVCFSWSTRKSFDDFLNFSNQHFIRIDFVLLGRSQSFLFHFYFSQWNLQYLIFYYWSLASSLFNQHIKYQRKKTISSHSQTFSLV